MAPSSGAPSFDSTSSAANDNVSVHVGEPDLKGRRVSPWAWIPSVYLAQGLQYTVVNQLLVIVFITMGVPKGDALYWVNLLTFPWIIKPLWGALVDRYWNKRGWTYLMQFVVGISLVGTALVLLLPGPGPFIKGFMEGPPFLYGCAFFLTIVAFAGATHDIACDGYYMLACTEKQQAWFVGTRSAVFRLAWWAALGPLVWLAGVIQTNTGLPAVDGQIQSKAKVESAHLLSASEMDALFREENWPKATDGGQAILMMPDTVMVQPGDREYVAVRLAQPPADGEKAVVTVTIPRKRLFEAGYYSIPEANSRIEFTKDNWRTGIEVPVEADPKTPQNAQGAFRSQAGNVPVSWMVALLICAGFFLLASVYHKFLLPYPPGDGSASTNKFFLIPLGIIILAVGIPVGLGKGLLFGLDKLQDSAQAMVVGKVDDAAYQDLREAVDGTRGKKPVNQGDLMDLIRAMREENLAPTGANLEATLELRRILQHFGVFDHPEIEDRLFDFLEHRRENPDLYGNSFLNRVLRQAQKLNGDAIPENRQAVHDILARAHHSYLEKLEANPDSKNLIGALKAIETVCKKTGESLPASPADLQKLVEKARETPSRLAIKGFQSLYTVSEMALLILIIVFVVKIPVLFAPVKALYQKMSDVSTIGFYEVFDTFFAKPRIWVVLGYLLTYRLGEVLIGQIKTPFLLNSRESGGLGLSLAQFAFTNSTVYLFSLLVGGLLGGMVIARFGLKRVIWVMVAVMHVPNLFFYILSVTQPANPIPINLGVGVEAFGYGFGLSAFLMVMILAAQGPYKTAHYALCTGFMALGAIIPGMCSGYLQEVVGYRTFFIIVMISCIPGMIFIPFLKIDPNFGRKAHTEKPAK